MDNRTKDTKPTENAKNFPVREFGIFAKPTEDVLLTIGGKFFACEECRSLSFKRLFRAETTKEMIFECNMCHAIYMGKGE